jgi:hypothetical protein
VVGVVVGGVFVMGDFWVRIGCGDAIFKIDMELP